MTEYMKNRSWRRWAQMTCSHQHLYRTAALGLAVAWAVAWVAVVAWVSVVAVAAVWAVVSVAVLAWVSILIWVMEIIDEVKAWKICKERE